MNDLIERQKAIDALADMHCKSDEDGYVWIIRSDAWARIDALPSAQPERKRGQWIYNSPVTMKCDQCGLVIKDWDWHRFKFCPNCDCDMRGEENG